MADNSFYITFKNSLDTEFTLGKLNDGFSNPELAQDMRFTQTVSSPLSGGDSQTLAVEQVDTFVDAVKNYIPLAAAVANPSGRVSASVVWTCYPLELRFGISATIDATRLEAVGNSYANDVGITGISVSPPAPDLSWSYMMDSSPDQPVTWITPDVPTAPLTRSFTANPGFCLSIVPIVEENSIQIQSEIKSI